MVRIVLHNIAGASLVIRTTRFQFSNSHISHPVRRRRWIIMKISRAVH